MSTTPRQLNEHERSGGSVDQLVIVYVCPECSNYYGSSSMGDLEKEEVIAPPTAKDAGKLRGHRSDCPNCKTPRRKRFARLVPLDEEAEIRKRVKQTL